MTGTGPGAVDQLRDWRRSALIAAPWALAAVLGLVGVAAAWDAPPTAAPAATPAATPAADVPTPAAQAPGTSDAASSHSNEPARDRPGGVDLPAAVELGVLAAARTALGVAGLATTDGAGDRWPVDARVVSLQEVTATHAVATVHGLVLEHHDGSWRGPRPRAVAVLVRTQPNAAVVGQAWPLAAPTGPTSAPALRPLADPDPSIVAALHDGGWTIDEITAAEASDDALLRVSLRGSAPGRDRVAEHVVWLLDAPGGPRLLPLTTDTDDEELP